MNLLNIKEKLCYHVGYGLCCVLLTYMKVSYIIKLTNNVAKGD